MSPNSTKTFSFGKALLLSIAVGLFASFVSIGLQVRSETFVQGSVVAEPSPIVGVVAAGTDLENGSSSVVGLGSSFNPPGLPVRLVIPAIGVDAAIQDVGMSWSGVNMGVPTNFTDAGWYKYGPLPGMPGSAVIDGHLDGKYVPQAVFYNLQNLKAGDAVNVVDASGTTLQFQVVGSKIYDYNASSSDVFSGDASRARLNLVTCAGDWDKSQKLYNKRIVVFTELVTTN